MASIVERKRKDGTISYVAQIIKRTKGVVDLQESRTFGTRKMAEAWGKKREGEIARQREAGLPIVSQKVAVLTVSDAIDHYLKASKKEIGKTKAQVLATIQREHTIAGLRCDAVMAKDIAQLANEIAGRADVGSASTVANYLSHLAAVFRIAKLVFGIPLDYQQMQEALIGLKHVGLTAKSARRERLPTIEELDKLMKFFHDKCLFRPKTNPMHRIIAFAIFSTRRQDEIVRIEWKDYERHEKRVLVRDMKNPGDKMGNHVWVDLPDPCCAIIDAMPKTHARIFPYSGDAISAAFTRACKSLDIMDLRFHDLRHQGTTRLFEMGFSIPHAAAVTGHRSWNSLQRYSHVRQKVDKFERWEWINAVTTPRDAGNP